MHSMLHSSFNFPVRVASEAGYILVMFDGFYH
jgi:hypothetical protein